MMVDAVDLAQVANINGYSLAGKTGSAFIPDLVHGGYTNQLIDSYIGFGPTSNPRFIALIRLNTLPETSLAAAERRAGIQGTFTIPHQLLQYPAGPDDRRRHSELSRT